MADSLSGRIISHYRIIEMLGAGGMGEVYLAEDVRLPRKVALKVLPADAVSDSERRRRFEQEACAASSLTHPNIVVVHEVGCDQGVHFLAMEFLDGEALRQRLARGRLTLLEALNVANQLASTLVAAHKAGIIHRDLKPENVMLLEDDFVKLLDFGVAKLTEPTPTGRLEDTPTVDVKTALGHVIGTAHYMSPEQALGKVVDARSDLFSLGVVLFEMVAGKRPFGGSTGEILEALLTRDAPLLGESVPGVPPALDRIVAKALQRDRERRYQTAKEMLLVLKDLRRILEGANPPPDSSTQSSDSSAPAGAGSTIDAGPGHLSTAPGARGSPAPTLLSRLSDVKRHKLGALLVIGLVIAGISASYLAIRKALNSWDASAPGPASPIRFVPLTSTGNAVLGAISPDGKYMAYATGDAALQSLWLRQPSSATTVPLVPASAAEFWGLTFSLDGDFVYYVAAQRATTQASGALYRLPTLGGGASRIAEDVYSPVAISGDGRLGFFRQGPRAGDMSLVVARSDGAGQRVASVLRATGFRPEYGPAWSPDGRTLACLQPNTQGPSGPGSSVLIAVPLDGSAPEQISPQAFHFVRQIAWLADGTGLLVLGQERATVFAPQIWHVSYPSGQARQLMNQSEHYLGISVTHDGKSILAIQQKTQSAIWTAPLDNAGQAVRFSNSIGVMDGRHGLSWTPGGDLVYSSFVNGSSVLLVSDSTGSRTRQVTFGAGGDFDPYAGPMRPHVFFASNRGGPRQIWRVEADGSNSQRLTNGPLDWQPIVSPDGAWVYYSAATRGQRAIWRVGLDGRPPTQLSDVPCNQPTLSPDGSTIACHFLGKRSGSAVQLAVIPSRGGSAARFIDLPDTTETLVGNLRWMPDGRSLAFVDSRGGVSNVWTVPVSGGHPAPLTRFQSDRIFKFDLSRDGAKIACARGSMMLDVMLVQDFR